jgi:hypothetical protein
MSTRRLSIGAFTVLVWLGLPALNGLASQEEFLEWQSLVIQCRETPKAGKISCEVSMGEKGVYSQFAIHAFGKDHTLTEAQLAKLAGFPLSSLRSTHEAGYEEIGGYTVHFRLRRDRYDDAKKLVSEVVYVSVNKNGASVSGPRELGK